MAEQNKKNVRVQHKIDTSANWASANIVLLKGEIGLESDTGLVKFGNGVDTWNSLPYLMQDELQAIADAINEIGYELEWKADVEFSNLPDADIARANLLAAPISHASQFGEYGIGDKYEYGHVKMTGMTGDDQIYAKTKTDSYWVGDFNSSTYLMDAEYGVEFDDTTQNAPANILSDCDTDLYNLMLMFSGVLQTHTESPVYSPTTTWLGAKQTLIIPNHKLTYERYYYYDSSLNDGTCSYTERKKVGTSEITIHSFELDVPADDGWTELMDETFEKYFEIPYNKEPKILETDEVIVDIITSSNSSVAEYQQQVYTNIIQIIYTDNQVTITTKHYPDMDLKLKFLVIRTQED